MSQSLILIDALFSACWEKKKRKENKQTNKTYGETFFPGAGGQTRLVGCATQNFLSCEVQLKADLRISL
jgi:hypothetical protein